MHQRTRRYVGRWLFFALCVLPTVAVAASVLWANRPGRIEIWERALSDRLGLTVTAERLTHPRPGVTVVERLRLSDPETHERIARIRLIEIVEDPSSLTVVFSQPQVEDGQLTRIWQIVHRQLIHLGGHPSGTVRMACAELTCGEGPSGITLTDVRGQIAAEDAQRVATVEFRIAGQEMLQPAQARLIRTKHDGEPFTRVEFHTAGSSLPCTLFLPYLAGLERAGPDCRFRGTFSAAHRKDGWQVDVAGQLTCVDLDGLIGTLFPHKLSGQADVTLRKLRFQGGRVRSAEGGVSAGPGVVSRSLIYAMSDAGLAEEDETASRLTDTLIRFQQLAFTFEVDEQGLSLAGDCDTDVPGVMLTRDEGTLLVQPREQPVPVVSLVRCLVPDSLVQVPATHETDQLLRVLPIPELHPPGGGLPTQSRVRFVGGVERH